MYYRENILAGPNQRVVMKQRIRVVGLIKTKEGTLILKRNRGRSEMPILWELPTGKINFGEQPEEAISRVLSEYLNLVAISIKLKDVITFLALEGESRLNNLYIIYEITISESAKPSPSVHYPAFKYVKDFSNTNIHLTDASASVIGIELSNTESVKHLALDNAYAVEINVDGASRGNPGSSGIGYCIHDLNGKIIEHGGESIGFATSRVAEYNAMRKGVERAIELGLTSVRFCSDSLMVVNQLNGIFRVKNKDILPIYQDIKSKLKNFESCSFVHIPRTENYLADSEANAAIDSFRNARQYND